MPSESITFTPDQFNLFLRMQVAAFREVMEPAPLPRPELVTVGETSDPKLDGLVLCPACLGDRGSRWNAHSIYFWGHDPEHPDRLKRHSVRVHHPEVRKTISYDAQAVRAGLENGLHGKQCIACGAKMQAPVL